MFPLRFLNFLNPKFIPDCYHVPEVATQADLSTGDQLQCPAAAGQACGAQQVVQHQAHQGSQ